MLFLGKVILLVGLIRLLVETEKPILCAGLYAGFGFLLGALMGIPLVPLTIGMAISFALALLYFWLLYRIEMGSLLWFVVIVIGLLIGIV